ncbi:hypothetical protein QFZ82_003983 [Streptomyces sp. V4I23]|uniref:hypothetical protein n=1 Tax=Streptomyces sp. V4I23 TaxID=3042282 RepID=UPI0027874691|nr:hypothetical protein [Streptomyces sp. V4I23]MDQ1009498.1 hypothetical protein [Streptomyces sp. V4I23]
MEPEAPSRIVEFVQLSLDATLSLIFVAFVEDEARSGEFSFHPGCEPPKAFDLSSTDGFQLAIVVIAHEVHGSARSV